MEKIKGSLSIFQILSMYWNIKYRRFN